MQQSSANQIPVQKSQSDNWIVIPILPGRAEAWRRFVQELQGPRQPEWAAWCQRVRLSRLRVWLQANQKETTVLLQGRIGVGPEGLLDDRSPFDRWLRQQVLSFHGVDIAQFGAGLKPELILDTETE